MTQLELTEVQEEYLRNGCPECESTVHEVPDTDSTELYLWCDICDVSIDSDGGYTK